MTHWTPIGSPCDIVWLAAFPVAQRVAAVLALLFAVALPAQAVPLRLDWTLAFSYPPNPCIDGTFLVSNSLGLFANARDAGYVVSRVADPGPPDLSCGASGGGSAWFDAEVGTAIFGAYSGEVRIPSSDASDQPAYAFPPGTANGDRLVAGEPDAVPFVRLGAVCGNVFCPSFGPPELPLFAFASPGKQIGTLALTITAMPEPAPWMLLLLAGGAWWAGGRLRPRAAAGARP
jgi:hypothetical protein